MSNLRFFQEANGDYLSIDPSAKNTSGCYDGRGTCIAGVLSSVCSTGVSQSFLDICREVDASEVPAEWMERLA